MPGDLGYPLMLARNTNWSRGRGGWSIVWIVVHCTDAGYADGYPTSLGKYWAREDTQVSTHYGISDTEVVQYVRHADLAYAARDPANARGIHIEFSGRSAWTRDQWLAHDAMFRRGAALIQQIAARHNIPLTGQLLKPSELEHRSVGLTCHADLTKQFGGSHTDPGVGFPWDLLHRYIAGDDQEDEDMDGSTTFKVDRDGNGTPEDVTLNSLIGWSVGKTLEHDRGFLALHNRFTGVESALLQIMQKLGVDTPPSE